MTKTKRMLYIKCEFSPHFCHFSNSSEQKQHKRLISRNEISNESNQQQVNNSRGRQWCPVKWRTLRRRAARRSQVMSMHCRVKKLTKRAKRALYAVVEKEFEYLSAERRRKWGIIRRSDYRWPPHPRIEQTEAEHELLMSQLNRYRLRSRCQQIAAMMLSWTRRVRLCDVYGWHMCCSNARPLGAVVANQ